MKYKHWFVLCALQLVIVMFHLVSGDPFHPLTPQYYHHQHHKVQRQQPPPILRRWQNAVRQSPIVSSALSSPLRLAAFLFALPILPSMLMAPLAMAGISPAVNLLSTLMHSFPTVKPLFPFPDPLKLPDSASSTVSTDSKVPGARQLVALKKMAKMFRAAISRRYSNKVSSVEQQSSQTEPTLAPEIQDNVPGESIDQNSIVDMVGNASASIDVLLNMAHSVNATNSNNNNNSNVTPMQMEKSLKGVASVLGSMQEIYSVIRNGLRRYEITDTDCQSRIVCEIHQKIITHNKMLKTFSLNALDLLRIEKHVDTWHTLTEKSKQTIKFYINAAKTGFADKDCSKEFHSCPTLTTRNTLRLKKLLKSTPYKRLLKLL